MVVLIHDVQGLLSLFWMVPAPHQGSCIPLLCSFSAMPVVPEH